MFTTDFISHEPEDVYHAQSRSGEYMSSHMLADFRNSPMLYSRKVNGEIAEKFNPAFAFGSAVHKMVLEGHEAFNEEYTVSDGPVNPKTGSPYGSTTKAYLEWAAEQRKSIVSTADFAMIQTFRQSVFGNEAARDLLAIGVAEGVARAKIEQIPCQIRMDWFNPERGLVDYKSCAELRYFESDCRRYGYIFQMAFYRRVIRELIGLDVPVHIIATEKCEPFSTGVWEIVPDVLEQASAINAAALRKVWHCMETGVWPTGYETIRLIDSL